MTEKRFTTVELQKPNKWGIWYDGAYLSTYQVCILLNEYVDIKKENEQLKKDNTGLMQLLENQSIIIQELHSKLMSYQLKEPIVLTKEDLEVMGKAISYYTHGRCVE